MRAENLRDKIDAQLQQAIVLGELLEKDLEWPKRLAITDVKCQLFEEVSRVLYRVVFDINKDGPFTKDDMKQLMEDCEIF